MQKTAVPASGKRSARIRLGRLVIFDLLVDGPLDRKIKNFGSARLLVFGYFCVSSNCPFSENLVGQRPTIGTDDDGRDLFPAHFS